MKRNIRSVIAIALAFFGLARPPRRRTSSASASRTGRTPRSPSW